MSFEDEDPFWNSSDVKAFSFDDEDQTVISSNLSNNYATSSSTNSSDVRTLGSILAAKTSSNEPFLKPTTILCRGNKVEQLLDYLEDTIPTPHSLVPKQDPRTYITQIVDNRAPICFSPYKSKRDKLLLLDCAICCSDGNTITAATIFLSNTLKASIFIDELKKRPLAFDHFINYLETIGKSREVIDLKRRLGT